MAEFRLKPVDVVDPQLPMIELPDARPYLIGSGPHDYLCGACGNGLLLKTEVVLPQRVIIVCGKCRGPLVFDLLDA